MNKPLTESEYTTKMKALGEQLYFNPKRLDEAESRLQRFIKDEEEFKNQYLTKGRVYDGEIELSHKRASAIDEASRVLDCLTENLKSFPLRHVENLHAAMKNNHPAWRSNLDGLISKLGNGSIFVLHGPRGTGKTQLATALGRYLVEYNRVPKYAVLGDVFTQIKGTFKSDSHESEESIVSSLNASTLLVLDEVHEITGTEWQGRILTLLIDSRYRAKRDTILITNATEQDFLTSVGASVADRIAEVGYFVKCDWPSFRRARI
jgi:DNA replication protein DnaC